ncbi:4a-hydroxytetrahydrobiopterin dehydratase [Paracoccus aerodenitrificans]|uniref:4a-hydroxytetrahydrobiopterin dehydratase n=1 Tax=Paracoccus aerodenitrificans TaxID=3017781 RepID=UPI0022F00CBA|nr:4a-hydroxytetrahydrobiopterin dehydratase [Paracoccus aerodenitrificans]WBU63259.1 4a-hydroxytetrahydrobiopterin dehydratase [Paracoccus aerodenitrificans]
MPDRELAQQSCKPIEKGTRPHDSASAENLLARLDGWKLSEDGKSITRRFTFKGFLRAVEMANLAAWLGNKQDHHPDISFGFGYCEVTFSTHDAGGLTDNDFICAARLDMLVA